MIDYIIFPLTGCNGVCGPPTLFEKIVLFICLIVLIYTIYDKVIKEQDSVFINVRNKGIYSKLRILKEDIPKDFTEGTIFIYNDKKYRYSKDSIWELINE